MWDMGFPGVITEKRELRAPKWHKDYDMSCDDALEDIIKEFDTRESWKSGFSNILWGNKFKTNNIALDIHSKIIIKEKYGKVEYAFNSTTGKNEITYNGAWDIGHKQGLEWWRIKVAVKKYIEKHSVFDTNMMQTTVSSKYINTAKEAIRTIHNTVEFFEPENCKDNRDRKGEHPYITPPVGHFMHIYERNVQTHLDVVFPCS
ncbi:MAG: HNH/ENDO VII family nuclease [Oscillospiraceae bacterium]|jgi:hypothetical protein|nr:HNH/ENDO VII family nuclease [Oscillospiraceae bacterium]